MSKSKKGLRVGSYRVTPLGIGVLVAILLIVAAVIVIFVGHFGANGDTFYTEWTATPTPVPTAVPTPTPTPTPTPVPTPEPTPRAATIRLVGEITADESILAAAKDGEAYDFSEMFSYTTDLIGGADYTIAAVQGSMGGTVDVSGKDYIHTPASMVTALKDAGVDMINLAVNHALDGNFEDLFATITNCQNAGIDYVGAAASSSEKDTCRVVDINGIRVGFVSYTTSINGLEKKADKTKIKYGINFVTADRNPGSLNPKKNIEACRSAGAEVVVAFIGWGSVNDRNVTASQTKLAQYLCDQGADVIVGYNLGYVQGVSWLETKDKDGVVTHRALFIPSLGNFLSGKRDQYLDSGIVFQFSLEETASGIEITSPVYIPTCVWKDGDDENAKYYSMPVGQWLDTAPESMGYTQFTRMKEVWAEMQSVMGTTVASVYSGTGEIADTPSNSSIASTDGDAFAALEDTGDETDTTEAFADEDAGTEETDVPENEQAGLDMELGDTAAEPAAEEPAA